jgi:hypothetical protein
MRIGRGISVEGALYSAIVFSDMEVALIFLLWILAIFN